MIIVAGSLLQTIGPRPTDDIKAVSPVFLADSPWAPVADRFGLDYREGWPMSQLHFADMCSRPFQATGLPTVARTTAYHWMPSSASAPSECSTAPSHDW